LRTYNIHEAKTHLSRLVDEAEKGEPFIIAKAGKPKVKVVPIGTPKPRKTFLGALKGKVKTPADMDIKTPFAAEIEEMFYGEK
jgi:prevent-host-death family protein